MPTGIHTLTTSDPRRLLLTAQLLPACDRFPTGPGLWGNIVVPDVKVARTKRDVVMGRNAALKTALKLASGDCLSSGAQPGGTMHEAAQCALRGEQNVIQSD